jgi:hypothetical protein
MIMHCICNGRLSWRHRVELTVSILLNLAIDLRRDRGKWGTDSLAVPVRGLAYLHPDQ